MLDDPAVDSVVVSHIPMLGMHGRPWERVVAETVVRGSKPVVAVLVAAEDESGLIPPPGGDDEIPEHGSVPFYGTVEEAVVALQRVTRYAEWRARSLGEVPELERISRTEARKVVSRGARRAAAPGDGRHRRHPAGRRGRASSHRGHHVDDEDDSEAHEVIVFAEDAADPLTRLLAAYGIEAGRSCRWRGRRRPCRRRPRRDTPS